MAETSPEIIWQHLAGTLELTLRRSRYSASARPVRHFLDHLPAYPADDAALVCDVIEQLYRTHGQMRVCDLAAHVSLSVRQLERHFKALVGISPKLLARVIRFEAVRNHLMQHGISQPGVLAREFGYTYQAHLTHDFKHIGGCAPGQFLDLLIKRSQGFYGAPVPRPT